LVAGLADSVVFLPPAGSVEFYNTLPADYSSARLEHMKAMHFPWRAGLATGPVAVAFEDRVIVAPDVCFDASRGDDIPLIFLPPDGFEPQVLYPTTIERAERLRERPDVRRVKAETGSHPTGETGRPAPSPI
jgi:hypothetical protein